MEFPQQLVYLASCSVRGTSNLVPHSPQTPAVTLLGRSSFYPIQSCHQDFLGGSDRKGSPATQSLSKAVGLLDRRAKPEPFPKSQSEEAFPRVPGLHMHELSVITKDPPQPLGITDT